MEKVKYCVMATDWLMDLNSKIMMLINLPIVILINSVTNLNLVMGLNLLINLKINSVKEMRLMTVINWLTNLNLVKDLNLVMHSLLLMAISLEKVMHSLLLMAIAIVTNLLINLPIVMVINWLTNLAIVMVTNSLINSVRSKLMDLKMKKEKLISLVTMMVIEKAIVIMMGLNSLINWLTNLAKGLVRVKHLLLLMD